MSHLTTAASTASARRADARSPRPARRSAGAARAERPRYASTAQALRELDHDQAELDRARALLAQGRALQEGDPRGSFEQVHRAALRAAGVLVARANRRRKRSLPLNVWSALERIGGPARERAEEMSELVAERARLDRRLQELPDPALLAQHIERTAAHIDEVAASLVDDLPAAVAGLSS